VTERRSTGTSVYDTPARAMAPGAGRPDLAARTAKTKADLDEWCKEIAPSTELRKWYSHDPARFKEFTRRYHVELKEPERSDALAHLKKLAKRRTLTLLTATKQPEISEAESSPRAPSLTSGAGWMIASPASSGQCQRIVQYMADGGRTLPAELRPSAPR